LWVIRLHPGEDLVDAIMEFAREHSIDAGGIVTCVGSLSRARLRYANQSEYEDQNLKGAHFEIVSMVGTFSTTDYHLHLSLANERGEVFGGHASSGNKVYTTAEVLIVEGLNWEFRREQDATTTYRELVPVMRND
jgi:predicted DNA-binding protein with PD1-like motif